MELGQAPSREKAKAFIMAGSVYVNGQRELKAGRVVKPDDLVELRSANVLPFVSRVGHLVQHRHHRRQPLVGNVPTLRPMAPPATL